MAKTNTKKEDKKEPENKADERRLGMSDQWRARHLATLMHNLDCTWCHNGFGDVDSSCLWKTEEDECDNVTSVWDCPDHADYLAAAEKVIDNKNVDQHYIEELIRLHFTADRLLSTLKNSAKRMCLKAGVQFENEQF